MGSTQPVVKAYPYNFCNKQQRDKALKGVPDFTRSDPVLQHMIDNITTIEKPKKVRGPDDWLKTVRESGQDIARYKGGDPEINWQHSRCNKIYLFIIDNSITEEIQDKLLRLATAQFHGMDVKLLKAGQKLTYGSGRNKRSKKVPEDFIEAHNITRRQIPIFGIDQLNASEMLAALKDYKFPDTFAIQAVINTDLYPSDD